MEFFSSYIKMLLSVGLCAFICNTVCESFKTSKTLEKAISTTLSLCMFITILVPICSILKTDNILSKSFEQNDSVETYSSFSENIENALSLQISEAIREKTGISPKSTCVTVAKNNDGFKLKKITVTLNTENKSEKNLVSDLLTSITDESTLTQISEN